jgi:hypothetical protein
MSSPGSPASSAHDRYREAISELMLYGGRVAELAEIVDSAYDEMIDALVAALFKVETKAEETNLRIQSLEETVAKLTRRRHR